MKVVINKCYGGFSLSPAAVDAIAERKGIKLYWFANMISGSEFKLLPLDEVKASPTLSKKHYMEMAYTSPDPLKDGGDHYFENRPDDRHDPDLVAVVEELGEKANGSHAQLAVVEIPDDVDYEISEYDGIEWIAEKHRTWS